MELVEKVRDLLTTAFPPPSKIELEDDDGIIGTIVSSKFEGMESIDRINIIWDILDQNLTPDERRRVVIIVAATPADEIAYTS
jgi:stress-induced morphogen